MEKTCAAISVCVRCPKKDCADRRASFARAEREYEERRDWADADIIGRMVDSGL